MWTVQIKDQTARSVQSDLDLHCPRKLLVSSSVRKNYTSIGEEHWKTFWKKEKMQVTTIFSFLYNIFLPY